MKINLTKKNLADLDKTVQLLNKLGYGKVKDANAQRLSKGMKELITKHEIRKSKDY